MHRRGIAAAGHSCRPPRLASPCRVSRARNLRWLVEPERVPVPTMALLPPLARCRNRASVQTVPRYCRWPAALLWETISVNDGSAGVTIELTQQVCEPISPLRTVCWLRRGRGERLRGFLAVAVFCVGRRCTSLSVQSSDRSARGFRPRRRKYSLRPHLGSGLSPSLQLVILAVKPHLLAPRAHRALSLVHAPSLDRPARCASLQIGFISYERPPEREDEWRTSLCVRSRSAGLAALCSSIARVDKRKQGGRDVRRQRKATSPIERFAE